MEKNLSALGFMSGTSGDGVDTSVISSNGKDTINIPNCLEQYFGSNEIKIS